MATNPKNPAVDAFLSRAQTWQAEMTKLRAILLACPLSEELKWGKPCYCYHGANVIIVQPFKEYFALLYCKGVLLQDPHRILVPLTENMQAARQIRFRSAADITKWKAAIKEYALEAIEAEKAGLKVKYKETSEFAVPEELRSQFNALPAFRAAFEALTPGRQRGYLLYFAGAKQSKTRAARIEKYLPQIMSGRGLDD